MKNTVKVYKLTDLYGARRVAEFRKREEEINKLIAEGYTKNYLCWLHQQNWRQLTAGGERKATYDVLVPVGSVSNAA